MTTAMLAQRCVIDSAAAMEALGAAVARAAPAGLCVYLDGPLAVGKTTFARGYVHACGHRGAVKSPTFTLVESYVLARRRIHHFDLYRLGDAEELEFIGIDEYFDGHAEVLVEWPERGAGVVPAADLRIAMQPRGQRRELSIEACSEAGCNLLSNVRTLLKSNN